MRVTLVRTPAGNFERLASALEKAGAEVRTVPAAALEDRGEPIVLAGVSSFSTLAASLRGGETLRRLAREGRPMLGICAGMQGMFSSSEEGSGEGLGLVPGRVRRLRSRRRPNLGWSRLDWGGRSPLTEGLEPGCYAYFAHSYRVPSRITGTVARTTYRGETFPSAVVRRSLWALQFHPELSGAVGHRILRNFLRCAEEAGA